MGSAVSEKTVLLNRIRLDAEARDIVTVRMEEPEESPCRHSYPPHCGLPSLNWTVLQRRKPARIHLWDKGQA